jgi:hypothetical protein
LLPLTLHAVASAPPAAQNLATLSICVLQADSATQKQQDLVRMTENSKRTLEQEVTSYRCAAVLQPAAIRANLRRHSGLTLVSRQQLWWSIDPA